MVFPRNNDAIQRLLEIVFFEKGATAGDRPCSTAPIHKVRTCTAWAMQGNYLFPAYVHLAAGQAEKGQEYFEKIYQEYFPDSKETLLGILEIFKGTTTRPGGS